MARMLGHVRLFATPWPGACQASLFMEFSQQEYGSGLPFPSPGHLPNLGSNLGLLHWQAGSSPLMPPEKKNVSNTVPFL